MLFVCAGDLRSDTEPRAQQLTLRHLLAGRWRMFLCILFTWAKIMGFFFVILYIHTSSKKKRFQSKFWHFTYLD